MQSKFVFDCLVVATLYHILITSYLHGLSPSALAPMKTADISIIPSTHIFVFLVSCSLFLCRSSLVSGATASDGDHNLQSSYKGGIAVTHLWEIQYHFPHPSTQFCRSLPISSNFHVWSYLTRKLGCYWSLLCSKSTRLKSLEKIISVKKVLQFALVSGETISYHSTI